MGTLFFVVRYCLRFCEILKILTGKSNLALKFAVVKREIEKLMKKYPDWKFQHEKEDIFKELGPFKQFLKSGQPLSKNKVCRWCFKAL